MAARINTKTKKKRKFNPAVIIKTNGRFSKGKLAIVVVSFVSIAVIISQLAFATSWSEQFFADSPGIYHQTGAYSGVSHLVNGRLVPIWYSYNPHGYMWYGPYDTIYVPQPSGMNYLVCTMVAGKDAAGRFATTEFKFEFSINNGRNILYSRYYQVSKWQPICFSIHLRQGIYTGVEYRIAYVLYANTHVEQVNIQKQD